MKIHNYFNVKNKCIPNKIKNLERSFSIISYYNIIPSHQLFPLEDFSSPAYGLQFVTRPHVLCTEFYLFLPFGVSR